MITYHNLTPHVVDVLTDSGEFITYQPVGPVARLEPRYCDDIKILGKIIDLPEPEDGVRYIVSLPVALVANRPDLVVPDQVERDRKGRPTHCRRLMRVLRA